MTRPACVGNPRFFNCSGPHRASAVAAAAGCEPPRQDGMVRGLASIALAQPDEISFVSGRSHAPALARTQAGWVLVCADMAADVPPGTVAMITPDPMAGWLSVAALFHPAPCGNPGIHPSATVADTARIDGTAEICAQAVVEAGAEIGPECRIGAGAVIGRGVTLGPGCRIGSHATISHALLGARVYVYPGAKIGQEGFGFVITPHGFQSVPQLGCVIIGDDVEIGANTTIDRGALRDTVIGAGTRLDNQVQVAHGVRIGRHCAIAAQVGISGSVEIGDGVVVGGQAGFAEHVSVGSRAQVGAQSGVMSDIEPNAIVVGSPARPSREVFREIATLRKLARPKRP